MRTESETPRRGRPADPRRPGIFPKAEPVMLMVSIESYYIRGLERKPNPKPRVFLLFSEAGRGQSVTTCTSVAVVFPPRVRAR